MVVAKAVSVVLGVVKRHHHLNQTLTDCYLSLPSLTRSPAFRNKDNHARPEKKNKNQSQKAFVTQLVLKNVQNLMIYSLISNSQISLAIIIIN